MIFFSSDHHFGHRAIIDYADRPFETVGEMDDALVEAWNARVSPKDEVYYLGDISMTRTSRTAELVNRLNGRIYYLRGNHDDALKPVVTARFEWVKDYYELRHQKAGTQEQWGRHAAKIILFHYPIQVWRENHFGSWHLHGHSHGSLRPLPSQENIRRLDVSVDTRPDYAPYSLDEITEIMSTREHRPMDHHGRRAPKPKPVPVTQQATDGFVKTAGYLVEVKFKDKVRRFEIQRAENGVPTECEGFIFRRRVRYVWRDNPLLEGKGFWEVHAGGELVGEGQDFAEAIKSAARRMRGLS